MIAMMTLMIILHCVPFVVSIISVDAARNGIPELTANALAEIGKAGGTPRTVGVGTTSADGSLQTVGTTSAEGFESTTTNADRAWRSTAAISTGIDIGTAGSFRGE